VSVGEEDHVKPAVQQLGTLDLWSISMKPGKPFAYGQIGSAHFVGLPGNPVSSFITFVLLVKPILAALQGQAPRALSELAIPTRADFAWPKVDKRREFLRVKRNAQGGLDIFPNQSSGVLTSVAWADGLVDNPAGSSIAVGDTVRYLPFAQLLS
jgi:molybdopterin molybdotransferase